MRRGSGLMPNEPYAPLVIRSQGGVVRLHATRL